MGADRAESFRRLGIRCVADLLRHLPLRYEHELAEQSIEAAATTSAQSSGKATITVSGEVAAVRVGRGRQPMIEVTLEDESGTLRLAWFNAPWMRGRLHPGTRIRVTGQAKPYGDVLQIVNPKWEKLSADNEDGTEDAPRAEGFVPVYPASEDLPSRAIGAAVTRILESAVAKLDDHLTPDYREKRALPALADAYRSIHRPQDEDDAPHARRRLAFDELLMLQLGVMLKRRHRRDTLQAPALVHSAAIDEHITQRFPFSLTGGQRQVIDDIVGDVTTTVPMTRLLQGDVGAGKTVVALYAMLLAVASKHQAALMAPTELLAEQHHASIGAMLQGSDVTIELLTGSMKAAARADLIEGLETGAVDMVVATHALLTETVTFRRLAVAVVDEQHRFGVHQRATIRSKSTDQQTLMPHTLVMTATPIPRTLSLTIFGDLDVSTIRELPPGRRPVRTEHLSAAQAPQAYAEVETRIARGEQAFIVGPVIVESEAGRKDVSSHLQYLQGGPLAGRRLAAMHGRLAREERETVMDRFRQGEIDAIVATTVIEVGVDVSNATIMVIEHADRFGLAQLHQLRGRVGRGDRESVCILVADPTTDDGRQRLEAIRATTDGFAIAERDLEIRGPGELFGARQSGLPPFHVADLPRDIELLRLARRDATDWIDENPTLSGARDALLKKRLLKTHGKALGLGDVG